MLLSFSTVVQPRDELIAVSVKVVIVVAPVLRAGPPFDALLAVHPQGKMRANVVIDPNVSSEMP
jgi:hypothetical protein